MSIRYYDIFPTIVSSFWRYRRPRATSNPIDDLTVALYNDSLENVRLSYILLIHYISIFV